MTIKKLSRRTILRGAGIAGAVTIGLPLLEAMLDDRGLSFSKASAQPTSARRFVVMHWPQGLPMGWNGGDFFFPTSAGSGYSPTAALQPFVDADLVGDVNIVSGLTYERIRSSLGDAHGHAPAFITGYETVNEGGIIAQGPSADQVAARVIGTSTRFASLATGLYTQGDFGNPWTGRGAPVPLELSPQRLFDRVFGSLSLPEDEAMLQLRRTQSVLDLVKDDITALQRTLGSNDRARLEDHLTSIRELERAVTSPPSTECAAPARPADVPYDDGDATEYARLMIDLVTMALRCDLTRVAFVSLGGIWRTYPHLGVGTDYHNVCHTGFNEAASVGPRLDDDRELAAEYYRRIGLWHMEQVAYFVNALKTPDAMGGSLLDDMAFVALSEFGDGGLHHESYIPIIAAGRLGGMTGGRHVVNRCDFAEGWQEGAFCASAPGPANRCINDLWQSALTGLGALGEGDIFGDPSLPTTTIPGLWGA